jgi:chromosome segregation ATPase
MTTTSGTPVMIDSLESRMLLHGGGGFSHFLPIPKNPTPAIQVEIDAVKEARAKLAADTKALAPVLKADRKALRDAIAALEPTLAPLKAELKADAKSWASILKADEKAVRAARKAQAVIDADPAVQAAKAKLEADLQVLKDDAAALEAAIKKLRDAIKASKNPTT